MSDVVLTQSYLLRHDEKEFRALMPYPPLGTLYAATALRRAGIDVALFDSMLTTSENELAPFLGMHSPRIVVIYDDDFNYLTKMCLSRMRSVAFAMTRLARERGCMVIVHGSDPADHAMEYLKEGAHYVVIGEGDLTLHRLVDLLLGRTAGTVSEINGLVYMEDGRLVRTPPRPVAEDLDTLGIPSRDFVDIEHYRRLWKRRHGFFSTNIVTTRGCPFHCNWCAKPIYGQVYHSRSAEHVVEEMIYLKTDIKPDHLWFCDDIFGLKPGWVGEFASEVRRRDALVPFKCLSRADLLLSNDTIRLLSLAGCQTVWIGAESGSQKILDAMEKGTTVEQIYASRALLKEHGIRVGFFLQYGYPGETKHDIERTLSMVRDCRPDELGVSVSYPLPGTKFYDRVKADLGEKQNWFDSADLDPMYRSPYHPDFYRALHAVTHKQLRIWQGLDLLKSLVRQPASFSQKSARRLAASAYHAATLPTELVRMERFADRPSNF